jgi:putative flippase GtrA
MTVVHSPAEASGTLAPPSGPRPVNAGRHRRREEVRGWHSDPLGVHELRYFSLDGRPTRLVSDEGERSYDPPWPAPATFLLPPSWVRPSTSVPQRRHRELLRPSDVLDGSGARVDIPFPPRPEGQVGPEQDDRSDLGGDLATPPSAVAPSRRAVIVRRLVRFGSVSAIATATSLSILGVLVGIVGLPAITANVIATVLGAVLSFELNRKWVWKQKQRFILRQALPYFIIPLSGLVVSTFAVRLASNATHSSSRLFHTVAVEMASLASYGVLWIVQFVLCDRVLFRTRVSDSPELLEGSRLVSDSNGESRRGSVVLEST